MFEFEIEYPSEQACPAHTDRAEMRPIGGMPGGFSVGLGMIGARRLALGASTPRKRMRRITHRQAAGRDHRRWYDQQRPELFAQTLRAAKKALDPNGIFNAGILIDPWYEVTPNGAP